MLRAMEYRPFLNQPLPDERDQALALIAGALVKSGKQEKVHRGMEYLEELVERYPDAAVLHAHLGVTYAGETLPLASLKHKTRVLEIQGTQENLLADQVQAMLHAGQVAKALKALEELEKGLSVKRATYIEVSRKLQTTSKGAYGGPWADLAD